MLRLKWDPSLTFAMSNSIHKEVLIFHFNLNRPESPWAVDGISTEIKFLLDRCHTLIPRSIICHSSSVELSCLFVFGGLLGQVFVTMVENDGTTMPCASESTPGEVSQSTSQFTRDLAEHLSKFYLVYNDLQHYCPPGSRKNSFFCEMTLFGALKTCPHKSHFTVGGKYLHMW